MSDILLIEDNADYAASLSQIIEELMDHKVTVASTGFSGLERSRDEVFDLFLIDINLPDMQGWDVAKSLRSMSRYDTTPIIAMTGEDVVGSRMRSLKSGCNLYLPKPVDIEVLEEIITLYLRGFG